MAILPDLAATRSTCTELQHRLYTSLHHLIFEAAADQVSPPLSEGALRHRIYDAFPGPAIFAFHKALLDAATADDPKQFAVLAAAFSALPASDLYIKQGVTLGELSNKNFSPAALEVLQDGFKDDIGLTAHLVPPSPLVKEQALMHGEIALNTLHACAPDWYAELALIAGQVLYAEVADPSISGFGGVSAFDAFGAVVMNPNLHTSPARALMEIVHESAHQHMFLLHLDDPILNNDGAAAYASPLRQEPRPMEGIFHAAWVSARMALAAKVVLASPARPTWSDDLTIRQARSVSAFRDCSIVIDAHADFTARGRTLYQTACAALDDL
jgi:hypothetical protein